MSERDELARDIRYVGYYEPEGIASYLIGRGWTRRVPPTFIQQTQQMPAPNSLEGHLLNPYGKIARGSDD